MSSVPVPKLKYWSSARARIDMVAVVMVDPADGARLEKFTTATSSTRNVHERVAVCPAASRTVIVAVCNPRDSGEEGAWEKRFAPPS